MNELLSNTLKSLLADTVSLKFLAQGYHWNVEGTSFYQFHELFSEIYNDYEGGIDGLAEWLRKLGEMAPSDLLLFYNNSNISESISATDGLSMSMDLRQSNYPMIDKFSNAVDQATEARQHALANFFAERMDIHQKINWQLAATTK